MSNEVGMKPLSEMQARLYGLLSRTPDKDVPIYIMYETVYEINVHKMQKGVLLLGVETRTMQQRLAPIIARVNEKLETGRIIPGEIKRTYRLDTKKAA